MFLTATWPTSITKPAKIKKGANTFAAHRYNLDVLMARFS